MLSHHNDTGKIHKLVTGN